MELGYHLMKLDDLDSIIQPNNYDGVRLRLRMCDGGERLGCALRDGPSETPEEGTIVWGMQVEGNRRGQGQGKGGEERRGGAK